MPERPFYKSLGTPFIELSSVDSTNNYALTQVREGLALHGAAFFAHEQVAGKGQRNKSWLTQRGTSLIISVIVDPTPLQLTQQFHLSACVAVSASRFLKKYVGDEIRIKWPNDLYWQDRKAGGILIENIIGGRKGEVSSSSQWLWAIIGVGININQASFPEELKNPVSLRQISGKEFDVLALAKEFCTVLDDTYRQLISNGFDEIYSAYNALLYKKDRLVKLKQGNRVFEATIIEVSAAGRLIVQHALLEQFDFGAVEWLVPVLPGKIV